jgi:hypothetical protein
MRDRLRDYGAEVEHSGQSFLMGDLFVIMSFGYSEMYLISTSGSS